MFDKMIFNAQIDFVRDAERIARKHHLIQCTEGNEIYYQSSALSNIEGIWWKIRGKTAQIKCSLHKIFWRCRYGTLDNSQMFTISDAKQIISELLDEWDINPEQVRITYYEVGLNIPVDHDPIEYISLAESIGVMRNRELFNDANFEKNRQKTTEKSKNIKKVFKIYDKGFEARDKGRLCEGNILRIETIYRRQSVSLIDFFSEKSIYNIIHTFYRDWATIGFRQRLTADKGIKSSQIDKAEALLRLGRDDYLRSTYERWKSGHLTDKQYRTIREFINSWDEIKCHFRMIQSPHEIEYKTKLLSLFNEAKN